MKAIFGRIWALWGLFIFIPSMFVALIFYLPCLLFPEPQKARWHRAVSRVWMIVFLNLIGCPLKVKGKKYFKSNTSYVIVCNHNSMMDVPVTTPFMPRAVKTMAKKSISRVPVFGLIYSFGSVLVDRKSEESRHESYLQIKRMLALGLDVVIYPEGTRNRTSDPLKPFYDGAFRLAIDTGNPVIPALIFNTKKVMPINKLFYLMPYKLHLHFLPAINSINISTTDLKEKAFKVMSEYYEANKKDL